MCWDLGVTQHDHNKGFITGRVVRLRPTTEDDLDLLASWFGDIAFIDHWAGAPLSRPEVAAKYIGRRRPEVESFVVLVGDAPIGYVQYWHAGAAEGGIDLILAPHARGHGYGPGAADALTHHLLHNLNWSRVTVDPAADNPRAIRAWAKAGFAPVHVDGDQLVMERRS
jgi:aminoglycoside 6'-N-acetyltransferase